MPKLIDYPRTTYAGAWELAEVVDDTGGKCEIETAARKLNRKVSGSFKAIIGSAVKFGLLTSKRELLSVTTLYKRIKHAYDKKEELLFHREAFLTPPLFTQICRKFRLRELPVQMLDVMLIREFGVEEINAQGVAKAFVEGCRMVNLLDEHNTMADIDASSSHQPRRELSAPVLAQNAFTPTLPTPAATPVASETDETPVVSPQAGGPVQSMNYSTPQTGRKRPENDTVANLFGLFREEQVEDRHNNASQTLESIEPVQSQSEMLSAHTTEHIPLELTNRQLPATANQTSVFELKISGPGLNSVLTILEEEDIVIAQALLEKIRRQLKAKSI
ncbi:hypothetical protein Q5H92_14160 [Hymenobacter sp. M29]|uniref:Uncharacterized protein n=1 Tax=Hymenobacter mellowenesis TaxID=3063995 RepID=A0ABT9ACE2_9BACT|nr:hypothetical protein [Hymenobacter sp. M29]MDO7847510.1 hypothetical protein [Hymenobacter sp. M29]